jgi:hypothetical protein
MWIALAALANIGQQATEHGAMDGIVAAAAFPGFSSPGVALHGHLFKCSDAARAIVARIDDEAS